MYCIIYIRYIDSNICGRIKKRLAKTEFSDGAGMDIGQGAFADITDGIRRRLGQEIIKK